MSSKQLYREKITVYSVNIMEFHRLYPSALTIYFICLKNLQLQMILLNVNGMYVGLGNDMPSGISSMNGK